MNTAFCHQPSGRLYFLGKSRKWTARRCRHDQVRVHNVSGLSTKPQMWVDFPFCIFLQCMNISGRPAASCEKLIRSLCPFLQITVFFCIFLTYKVRGPALLPVGYMRSFFLETRTNAASALPASQTTIESKNWRNYIRKQKESKQGRNYSACHVRAK